MIFKNHSFFQKKFLCTVKPARTLKLKMGITQGKRLYPGTRDEVTPPTGRSICTKESLSAPTS